MSLQVLKKSYLAKLGDFVFDLNSAPFQKLERETSYRWARLEIVGSLPQKQFIGPGDDKISLQGSLYPYHRGGLGQMEKLRVMASRGEPYLLVYSDQSFGQSLGRWVIELVKEVRTHFFDNGTPRKIDFSLELSRYAEEL